ncbi:MAG: hypothetical protein AABY22_21530 [Nanoarchaeota archaeon]
MLLKHNGTLPSTSFGKTCPLCDKKMIIDDFDDIIYQCEDNKHYYSSVGPDYAEEAWKIGELFLKHTWEYWGFCASINVQSTGKLLYKSANEKIPFLKTKEEIENWILLH